MTAKTFLIQSEGLGRGDEQLGKMLMANFLRLLGESQDKPETIIFWNTGVRLLGEGSSVVDFVKRLEAQGVEVLACTTCLEYFDLAGKIGAGKPTTMVKSIEKVMRAESVCL